jgi:hypothetical protein
MGSRSREAAFSAAATARRCFARRTSRTVTTGRAGDSLLAVLRARVPRKVKFYIYGPDGKLKTHTAFDTEGSSSSRTSASTATTAAHGFVPLPAAAVYLGAVWALGGHRTT